MEYLNNSNRLMAGRKRLESEDLLISLMKAIDNPDTPQAIYKTDENQIKSINGKNNRKIWDNRIDRDIQKYEK